MAAGWINNEHPEHPLSSAQYYFNSLICFLTIHVDFVIYFYHGLCRW